MSVRIYRIRGRRVLDGRCSALFPAAPFALLVLLLGCGSADSDRVLVAVASNFVEIAERLTEEFEAQTGHAVDLAPGSTGKLFAQIQSGAPYDLLLAADEHRPEVLEARGLTAKGARFTYALGQLALWTPEPDRMGDVPGSLGPTSYRSIALANPALAPYGLAARQTLEQLGLWHPLQGRLVLGENVAQAYALVASGNSEVGFVALSQIISPRNRRAGSRWEVPDGFHDPIRQDAVLLERAANKPAAREFFDFLASDRARELIESAGYSTP